MASRDNPRGVCCLHSASARHGERPSTSTNLRRSPPPARERSAAAGERALYDAPVSEPHIRKVRPDDLEEVWRVHVAASNDLLVRRGRPATRPGDAPAVTRLKARAGLDPRDQELPCDPGAAEKLTAEVFGHGRADDLAHWRGDGGVAVAMERGGELAAFAYRREERIGPAAGRDETALLQAIAAAAAAGAGSGRSVTMRVPGACASLLEALVSCGFRIGDPTLFMASRLFGRPELYLPSGPILY